MSLIEERESLLLIDGQLRPGGGGWMDAVDPATERVIGRFALADESDVGAAIDAAERAFPEWSALGVAGRVAALQRLASAIDEHADEIIALEVADSGNTIKPVRGDVANASANLRYFSGLARELKGETVPASPDGLHFSVREPYGVVGSIYPFNHPFMFGVVALTCPLVAGNTVVLKPPEQSSLTSGVLARLCADVLPPGVVNVVSGAGDVGAAIVADPRVKRIAFTGAVPTGMAIQRTAAQHAVKHVSLELGGKNPLIIYPDADVDAAISAAVDGMNLSWQGQSCGSTSRVLVHESLADRVIDGIVSRARSLRVGAPGDEATDMGPLNSAVHYERVLGHIEQAMADGAKLVTGGGRPNGPEYARGYWLEPTVFTGVTPDMRLFKEEVFGPVLAVTTWSDDDDVIAMANAVDYGLTASVWTRDLDTARRAARALRAGYVWVNDVAEHYLGCGFGGFKNSGVGRDEGIGELLSYTEEKWIHVR